MSASKAETMSPRDRAASENVRKGIEAAALEKRRSFITISSLWFILSGIEFRDLFRAQSVQLVDVLIPVGMTVGWGAIIAFAWWRPSRTRRKELASR